MGHWCEGVGSKCDYLGCLDRRVPYPSRACFALMKRCHLPACGGQRGHIEKAHMKLSHLGEDEQVRVLRKAFWEKENWLTEEEKEKVKRYQDEMDRVMKRPRIEGPK